MRQKCQAYTRRAPHPGASDSTLASYSAPQGLQMRLNPLLSLPGGGSSLEAGRSGSSAQLRPEERQHRHQHRRYQATGSAPGS
jgi:hypothetical protein